MGIILSSELSLLLLLVVYLHSSLHVSGIVLPKNLWGVISSVWSFVVLMYTQYLLLRTCGLHTYLKWPE